MRITLPGALAISMAIAAAGAVQPSAHAADPTPTSRVTLLAGGPSWLVYGVTPVVNAPDVQPTTVYARSKGGSTKLLETVANISVGQGWSLNHGMVTTVKESSSSAPQRVEWWNLSTAEKGVHSLSKAHRWAGSAPGGWQFVSMHSGYVGRQSAASLNVTSLHDPFGKHVGGLTKGPSGVLVSRLDAKLHLTHDFAYLRYAHPTKPVRLHSAANICDVLTATAAYCEHARYDNNDDESDDPLSVQVMRLSGAKPTSLSRFHGPAQVAAGTQAASFVTTQPGPATRTTAYFLSTAGRYTSEYIGSIVPENLTSAYGAVLYTDVTADTVYSITNATTPPVTVFSTS
jgi:hypothetical protein